MHPCLNADSLRLEQKTAMCPAGAMFFQANPLVHQELPIKPVSFYTQLDHFLLLITGLFTNETLKV